MHRSPRLLSSALSRRLVQRPFKGLNFNSSLGRRSLSSATHVQPTSPGAFGFGILITAVASGLAGYYYATQANSGAKTYDALVAPKYASKVEIQQAVRELEGVFPPGGVSTNPDVLKQHGFSVRSLNPIIFIPMRVCRKIPIILVLRTALSSLRIAPMM